jgi:hypothetical protein
MVKRVHRVIDVNYLAVGTVSMGATPASAQLGGGSFRLNLGCWEAHLAKRRFHNWLGLVAGIGRWRCHAMRVFIRSEISHFFLRGACDGRGCA